MHLLHQERVCNMLAYGSVRAAILDSVRGCNPCQTQIRASHAACHAARHGLKHCSMSCACTQIITNVLEREETLDGCDYIVD